MSNTEDSVKLENDGTSQSRLISLLLILLVIVTPYENILEQLVPQIRFGLIIAVLIIALSLGRIEKLLKSDSVARLFVFAGFVFVPAHIWQIYTDPFYELNNLLNPIFITGYSLLALAIASWAVELDFQRLLYWVGVVVLGSVASLALIDIFIVRLNIPYFNEQGVILRTGYARLGSYLGPFSTRTIAAVILEGYTVFIFLHVFTSRSLLKKALTIGLTALICAFMLQTGNRSFFLSIAVAIILIVIMSKGTFAQSLVRLLSIPLLIIGIIITLQNVLPDYLQYTTTRSTYFVETSLNDSDSLRVDAIVLATDYIVNENILGNGNGLLFFENYGRDRSPHSNPVFYFVGAGILGLLWFTAFTYTLIRLIFKAIRYPGDLRFAGITFAGATVAQYIGGLGHVSINNVMLWLFLGLLYSISLRIDKIDVTLKRDSE